MAGRDSNAEEQVRRKSSRTRPSTRLEVRYPEVHLVFADSRRYAEDWTYRFLTTALTDTTEPTPNGD